MTKVLQISNYMYPNIGGIEQVARNVASALKSGMYEQKIICFNEDSKDNEYVCHRKETVTNYVDGVEVIRCGCVTKLLSQSISFSYPNELRKLMNEFNPDIVIFHYPNPFVAFFLLTYKRRKFKLFIYWHLDITKQKILRKLFHKQNLTLIGRADKIIGATPMHVNESAYSFFFKGKKEIIPYSIDENRLEISFSEIEKANEIRNQNSGKILCFFIGRHVEYKGLKYLIDASSRIENNKVHFLIAGNGELTSELINQAQGDEKVEFVGKISDSAWRSYLYACDIFCFPSITRNEAFGLALAEGMYYGKPAVTFSIPGSGVNYVNIGGETGIECPNRDSKAYAEAICKLVDDSELRKRLGRNAKKRIKEKFTQGQFKNNIHNLIRSNLSES